VTGEGSETLTRLPMPPSVWLAL